MAGHRGELGIVVGVGKVEGGERGFLGIGNVVGKEVGVGAGGGGRWGGGVGGVGGHRHMDRAGRGEQRKVSGTKRIWLCIWIWSLGLGPWGAAEIRK